MFAIEEKLEMLPFEEKRALLRYVYSDTEFKFRPITKQEAIALTPPDESWQEGQWWWFNRGKRDGVFLEWDGFVEEGKLLNLLKQLNNNDIVSFGPHSNTPLHTVLFQVREDG